MLPVNERPLEIYWRRLDGPRFKGVCLAVLAGLVTVLVPARAVSATEVEAVRITTQAQRSANGSLPDRAPAIGWDATKPRPRNLVHLGGLAPGECMNEDFEAGGVGWVSTGLWHLAASSSCPSPQPGFSSPVTAQYYGQEASCTYNNGSANSGTLTSPLIDGITAQSTLTFSYLRQVESFAGGSFDRTRVEILAATGSATVLDLDSTSASSAVWTSSGAISLAAFAGQQIQVRFLFDTVDNQFNNFIGWFVDDVVVIGDCGGPVNAAPQVTILSPPDGSTDLAGIVDIFFSGTAIDEEDGDLTTGLNWTSSIDGVIGSAGAFASSSLSPGLHTITATAVDSGGRIGSATIRLTLLGEGGIGPPGIIDWTTSGTVAYSNQDGVGSVTSEDSGATLALIGNRWRRTIETFDLTPFSVLEFEFRSDEQGEIHGIGFDRDDILNNDTRIFQLFGTQNWGGAHQQYSAEYSSLGTWVSYRIPVGGFYSGTGFRLVLVNDNDAGPPANSGRFRNIRLVEVGGEITAIDFNTETTSSYSNQDGSGQVAVEDGGATLMLLGNRWRQTSTTFAVVPTTVVAFDFESTSEGEMHSLGFDENGILTDAARVFNVFGTQNWGGDIDWVQQYDGTIGFKTFVIPVGRFYTGTSMRLIFANDKDAGAGTNVSRFRNVRVYQLN